MADADGITDVVDLGGNGKGVALNVYPYFGTPIVYDTFAEFPSIGLTRNLYVANDTEIMYRWDHETQTYIILNDPSSAIVSDEAYGPTWFGITNFAPSKNAVYVKVEAIVADIATLNATVIQLDTDLTTLEGVVAGLGGDLTNYLLKAGGTMTGALEVVQDPYDETWENSAEAPSKGDLFDKISAVDQSINDIITTIEGQQASNGIVSGGQVVWESDLTFRVSAAVYYIDGIRYESLEQTVTLSAADPTDGRIDVLALDNTGTFVAVEGTPASAPSEPDIDASTQLKLTFVLVEATATEPGGIVITDIYLENTEWTTSTSGSGINANSTNNPKSGTKCVEATNMASNAYVQFDKGAVDLDINSQRYLRLFIRSKAAFANNRFLRLRWYANGVALGSPVTLASGYWGFDSSQTAGYQLVAIPISQFVVPLGTLVDQLRIIDNGGALGFYIDEITLESFSTIGEGEPEDFLTEADIALFQPIPLAPNFTDDGEVRFRADVAMTLTEQATSGTGSVAYEKSTAGAPGTFSSTTSPITLEAGAWLKIVATSVTTIFAVALKRTA